MTLFSIFLLCSVSSLIFSQIHATKNHYGFSVDLMHRDSPGSPLYNPSQTRYHHLQNAVRRSVSRGHRFSTLTSSPTTMVDVPVVDIIPANGEYLMNISIGTPPFDILAIADTGSDLIWTQCQPCNHCYKQDAPIFNWRNSSSCSEVTCGADICKAISGDTCVPTTTKSLPKCQYSVAYGDQSYSNGAVLNDTFTFATATKSPFVVNGVAFGCGTNNDGTFDAHGSGIVGLGGGLSSLISQMWSLIRGEFSYCLVPLENQSSISKMNFGATGLVKGDGAVSTKLVKKDPATFYYLTLDGISVGSERFDLTTDTANEGNIIIDSGTTLTLLPRDLYNKVEASVIKQVKNKKRVDDPNKFLNLCYESETNVETPELTAHFSGADVKLKGINAFIRISDGIVCLAFAPSKEFSIWGNVAQYNFLVGYDIEAQTVSFKPKDCSLP